MNVIKTIPTEYIRPFEGQPRRYFDPQALQELADSIKTHGQYTPAWVVPVKCIGCELDAAPWEPDGNNSEVTHVCIDGAQQYELIAGERRWRACKLADIATLVCEVRPNLTLEQQYIASVMENFGRKDCTTMETARSVKQLLEQYGGDYAKTANVFARSEAWVRQINMLNRLLPEVATMLEPPNARLSTQVGVALANLQADVQIRLASEIAKRGLRLRAALSYIRVVATDEQRVSKQGKRRPSADFEILKTFISTLGTQAQAIMMLGEERIQGMFTNRDPKSKVLMRAIVRKRIEQLRELEVMLQ